MLFKSSLRNLPFLTSKKNSDLLFSLVCDITNYEDVNKTISKIEKEISPINIALLGAAAYSPNKTQNFDLQNEKKGVNLFKASY